MSEYCGKDLRDLDFGSCFRSESTVRLSWLLISDVPQSLFVVTELVLQLSVPGFNLKFSMKGEETESCAFGVGRRRSSYLSNLPHESSDRTKSSSQRNLIRTGFLNAIPS